MIVQTTSAVVHGGLYMSDLSYHLQPHLIEAYKVCVGELPCAYLVGLMMTPWLTGQIREKQHIKVWQETKHEFEPWPQLLSVFIDRLEAALPLTRLTSLHNTQ
jgi:hypothetical protein